MSYLIKIATFDIFDAGIITDEIFPVPETSAFNDEIDGMGFSSMFFT
jgi:hypothetical protein